ncbi:MAG: GNAT family N-acetyltransferase [Planctomycetes bacterium]|nr:GNAT family N-acetyltransferase [Planctomycetota bacterium]
MANEVVIDRVDPKDVDLLAHLHNQVVRPAREPESFTRRFLGRHNVLCLAARVGNEAAGFYIGFELKPAVHFAWMVCVIKEFRRMGVASQLMQAAQSWAKEQGYISIRFECNNTHRPMLHFGISEHYEIVGIRWDPDTAQNLVIFERLLDRITFD